jgi:SAM-dependent methyltransferase
MGHEFDKDYWDAHWQQAHDRPDTGREVPPNPHLLDEVGPLAPGTALEAGCGEGAEAIWLAEAGWVVTAVDISDEALGRAAGRAAARGVGDRVTWVRADLGSWEPAAPFDLVTTHYAHPSMPQLEFYDRLGSWVALGGSLLIVGHADAGDGAHHHHGDDHDHRDSHAHGHDHEGSPAHRDSPGHGDQHDHGDEPPAEARVTPQSVTARLDPATWEVVTAHELTRTLDAPGGAAGTLRDVVVLARRRDG